MIILFCKITETKILCGLHLEFLINMKIVHTIYFINVHSLIELSVVKNLLLFLLLIFPFLKIIKSCTERKKKNFARNKMGV